MSDESMQLELTGAGKGESEIRDRETGTWLSGSKSDIFFTFFYQFDVTQHQISVSPNANPSP